MTRKQIDWDLVEVQYRAGVRSLKDIGEEFGVSDAGILKRAKRDGWTRDLAAKIKAKADAKVSAAAVSAEVSVAKAANEAAVVEANAENQAQIRIAHRQDIARTRRLFYTLLSDLEVVSDGEGQEVIEKMTEILETPPDGESAEAAAKRVDRMRKKLNELFDMSTRIDGAKKVTEMLEKLVRLERQAHGIDDAEDRGKTKVEDLLDNVASYARARGLPGF